MKKFDSTKIKNIAVAGHAGSGKTSLTEALLYKSGTVDRLGKVLEGTTVSDYTADEIKALADLSYDDLAAACAALSVDDVVARHAK